MVLDWWALQALSPSPPLTLSPSLPLSLSASPRHRVTASPPLPLSPQIPTNTAYFIFVRYIGTGRDAHPTRVLLYEAVPYLSANCCKSQGDIPWIAS